MNASTETRLKIRAGHKHFSLPLVQRLLEERDNLNRENLQLRGVHYIGGHAIVTDNGLEVCERVPVVTVTERKP